MEELFQKIEDNFFENQNETGTDNHNKITNEETTENSSQHLKKEKDMSKTEQKIKRQSKLHLEKPEEEENNEEAENEIEEKDGKEKEAFDDEYADYCRMDKTGIHFQIISDLNVSIEIVPESLLSNDVEALILKYKGYYDKDTKLWIVPYTNYEPLYVELYQIESIKHCLHKVGSIAKECFENKTLTKLVIRRKKEDETIDYTNDDRPRNICQLPQKLQNTLYDFQKEGINFGIEHHCRFLLADEMGVGKTIQALSLAYLYRDSWPVLIVCPGSMKYLWKGEIRTWLGLKEHRINILNTSRQKISNEAYFYIISYDLVKNILKKLKNMTFDFVILDEAHSIKNKDSLRAKNILPIAVRAKRLILMTGTPLLAKPYEGYPLLYALRPDIFCYFKKFAFRYCDPQPTPFGITWSGTSNTKELHWILSTLMVRRLKRDVLNKLPPKRRQKVSIKTDPKILEEIANVRNKQKGRKGTLDAYTMTCKAKIEGVYEYISDILETDQKFVVFAYHYEMLDRIESLMKERKVEYIRIDGSTRQDIRYDYVNYFQQKESCKVAILSVIAASTGITLTAAHLVIFAELTWTPSIMIQAEDRTHRIGQKHECIDIKYLYGPKTLDDFILDKLQKKLIIVSTTLDDKKEDLGVKANPDLIHANGVTSKELLEHEIGEYNNEVDYDGDDLEKKMLDDLGADSAEKKKKGGKRKKNNKRNKSNNKRTKFYQNENDDSNSNDTSIISKNKTYKYPKASKSKDNNSESKTSNNLKFSGIKELRKSWASEKRPKSVDKRYKPLKDLIDEDFSKKTILSLVNNNTNIVKERLDNFDEIGNFNKIELDEKENNDENINNVNNINMNSKNDIKFYEESLLVNLHKTNNRRRTTTQEETKATKNTTIDLIEGDNLGNRPKTKSLFNPKDMPNFNENTNENYAQNNQDKIPLI